MTDPLTRQFLVLDQPPYRLPRNYILGRDLWDRQPVSCFNHIACCNLCNYLYTHDRSFRRHPKPYRQKSARSRHVIHSEANKVAVRLAKSPQTAKPWGSHVFAGGNLVGCCWVEVRNQLENSFRQTASSQEPFGDNKYHIILLLIDFSPVFDAL